MKRQELPGWIKKKKKNPNYGYTVLARNTPKTKPIRNTENKEMKKKMYLTNTNSQIAHIIISIVHKHK